MKQINACLMFDGTCSEAMKFYQKSLKADLSLKLYSEAFGEQTPPALKDRIMEARLTKGSAVLLGSDIMPNPEFKIGNNFTVRVECSSKQEVEEFTKALVAGGHMTCAPQASPDGAYFGMCTDKYRVDWMFSYGS